MKAKFLISLIILSNLVAPSMLLAKKKLEFRSEADATAYYVDRYNRGCRLYNKGEWRKAASEFERIAYFFPTCEAVTSAHFYLGVCFFEMKEYDFASEAFSNYLKAPGHPEFFEEAIQYKFCIAELFKSGHKKRFFGARYCPKWATGQDMALSIYDEVIVAVPNHELAAKALFSKGCLLKKMGEYRESIDAFQTLIRRFLKHELAPQAYLYIAQDYCMQARYEFQNPDLLALAELNLRKFQLDFPRDERLELVEGYVCRIKEMYAKGLCDIGTFYERINYPSSAAIYYRSAIEEFPDTCVADFCRKRLECIGFLPPIVEKDECQEETLAPEADEIETLTDDVESPIMGSIPHQI